MTSSFPMKAAEVLPFVHDVIAAHGFRASTGATTSTQGLNR
jgi:hypothetical protein